MTTRANITATQYEIFLARPENANRRFELIFGKIEEKMPTQLYAYIIQMLSGFLFVFLRENPIGYALIEACSRLRSTMRKTISFLIFRSWQKAVVH